MPAVSPHRESISPTEQTLQIRRDASRQMPITNTLPSEYSAVVGFTIKPCKIDFETKIAPSQSQAAIVRLEGLRCATATAGTFAGKCFPTAFGPETCQPRTISFGNFREYCNLHAVAGLHYRRKLWAKMVWPRVTKNAPSRPVMFRATQEATRKPGQHHLH